MDRKSADAISRSRLTVERSVMAMLLCPPHSHTSPTSTSWTTVREVLASTTRLRGVELAWSPSRVTSSCRRRL
ncbi:MAG: hypothetical protein CM1200mP2_48010 [Planctomycetaceae bacterium]|nr:MAG: hypothetical protein CM1200mP2_48010 [Planctomycetaceae bacterium]